VAVFETDIRKETQLEGVAMMKTKGVYKGHKPSIDKAKELDFSGQGMSPSVIARQLGMGTAGVYRALA
jgi:DNA invertase Pin-like site-specific DNA recombinase